MIEYDSVYAAERMQDAIDESFARVKAASTCLNCWHAHEHDKLDGEVFCDVSDCMDYTFADTAPDCDDFEPRSYDVF